MASKEPFSLATSIFTPFPGLPSSSQHGEGSAQQAPAPPLTKEEKLTKIMESLIRQHEAVRKNMLTAIENRGLELIHNAEQELVSTGVEVSAEEEQRQRAEDEESLKQIMQSLQTAREEGKNYEEKPPEWSFKTRRGSGDAGAGAGADGDGDVEMHDIQQRTQRAIRDDCSRALKELILQGVQEMVKYDKHAEKTYQFYKEALGRAKARSGDAPLPASSTPSSTTTSRRGSEVSVAGSTSAALPPTYATPGILRNRNEDPRINPEALRKMNDPAQPPPKGPRDGGWVDPRRR